MTEKRVGELGPDELCELVARGHLTTRVALEVLRHPFCTVEIAERIADEKQVLTSTSVRQLLCEIRGFPFSKTISFLATLPWVSLLELVGSPKTVPMVRRQAERKLLLKLPRLAFGEKVAMARRSPRPFFKALIETGDDMVLSALLSNGRLVENDILVILNTVNVSQKFCRELASHRRWGQYREVQRALVACPNTPYAVAISVLVLLGRKELEEVIQRPNVSEEVKNAVEILIEKRRDEERR